MIMHKLSTMMPKVCEEGCDPTPQYLLPGKSPQIECLIYEKPACQECYKVESGGWSYVCYDCKDRFAFCTHGLWTIAITTCIAPICDHCVTLSSQTVYPLVGEIW